MGWWQLGALALAVVAADVGRAQTNFANALLITGDYGSVSADTSTSIPDPGAPTIANIPPSTPLWFQWAPTNSGEVTFETFGSYDSIIGFFPIDTVLGVFTGTNVASLDVLVANDDLYPVSQFNYAGQNVYHFGDTNSYLSSSNAPLTPPGFIYSTISQPFLGPSTVRFNAVAGRTYYIAVDSKTPFPGSIQLNWSLHPPGVFRFATENSDLTGLTYPDGTPYLLYQYAATESTIPRAYGNGLGNASALGALVTVTRVAGSSGRVTVDYATEEVDPSLMDTNGFLFNGDLPAVAGTDYTSVFGTLTFDDHEMSKTIIIPVFNTLPARPNRVFSVVLSNPQIDPAESTGITTPSVDEMFGTALVRILDVNVDPKGLSIIQQVVTNIDLALMTTNLGTNILYTTTATNAVFNFQKANYRVFRAGAAANRQFSIWVNRTGTNRSSASINFNVNSSFPYFKDVFPVNVNNLFPLMPGSDYAAPSPVNTGGNLAKVPDFNFAGGYAGTLTWAANDVQPKAITFNILTNGLSQFNEDFEISLYDLDSNGDPFQLGMVNVATVTILPGNGSEGTTAGNLQPPAGSVDELYNADFGAEFFLNTTPPNMSHPGTDGEVFGVAVQSDDKAIVVGDFFSYDQTLRSCIARTTVTGYLDTTFNPGSGANDFISCVAVTVSNQVVIGGDFTSFNGTQRNGIARLNSNGTLDTTFNPGNGANGTVWALIQQIDGKIIIGGDFDFFNGVPRNHVARLNVDGSLDTSFDPGAAINGPVYAISAQADTSINASRGSAGGQAADYNLINVGAPAGILTIDYDMLGQPDDLRVYYGTTNGVLIYDTGFISFTGHLVIPFGPTNGLTTNSITIVMNQTGGQFGTLWSYTASIVASGASQFTIGGDFTSVAGIGGQDHIARLLNDGAVDFTFDPGAGVNGVVKALATQNDGNILVGGEFTAVNGQNFNRIARLNSSGLVDTNFFCGIGTDGTVYNLNWQTNGTIYVGGQFTRYNGTHRLGFARLHSDGTVDTSFLDTAYNQFAGLTREFFADPVGTVLSSAVQSDGGVLIGGTFSQVGGGQFSSQVRPESFTNAYATSLTRSAVRNKSNFARLIGGATPGPGNVGLVYDSYSVNKSSASLFVALIRTNGFLGPASANFSTQSGVAQSGVDYLYDGDYNGTSPLYWTDWDRSVAHNDGLYGQNGVLNDDYNTIFSGIPYAYVNLTITGNTNSDSDLNARLQLSNPANADQFYLGGENIALGVGLGGSAAPLTLIEDRHQSGVFGFASSIYTSSSNAPINVSRTGGTYGACSVQYVTTTNGSTAILNSDYHAASGTLNFTAGQTNNFFVVQVLQSNYVSAVEKTVNMRLFNVQSPANGQASLGLTNAVLRIINANFQGFLNFSTNNYYPSLSAGFATVTVTRTVGSKGTLTVKCATLNGTATNGVDFTGFTNTTLTWNNGDVSPRTIMIPLANNGSIGGSKSFMVTNYNATLNGTNTPALLGAINSATITISNDNSYGTLQFSLPAYTVNENGGYATLTVIRTGSALGTATVNYATADFSAFAMTNYLATNNTLTFAQGELAKTITVRILDDAMANPPPDNFYFTVSLNTPGSGVTLGSPSTAKVKIVDASSANRTPGGGDSTFDVGSGMNSSVLALALQSNGQILAGGSFTTVNGTPENYLARLNSDGSLDSSGFLNGLTGINNPVYSVASQTDDRVLVGGNFTSINGVVRNHISRLLSDGSIDSSFNPGAGADNVVYALAETFVGGSRKIYVAGAFNNINAVFSPGIARLNNNGTVDGGFVPGAGANDVVYAVAVYPTNSIYAGKVVIGGAFTSVKNFPALHLARLNVDGSMDTNFDLAISANGNVHAIAIQNDGKILLGGDFTLVNGSNAYHLARLNLNGSFDTTFGTNVNGGVDGTVNAIVLQDDNRILLVGDFTHGSGVTRHRLTRLLPDGKVDTTINFGDGANAAINAAVIQPGDGQIIIGGAFTKYDLATHQHIARIYGGSVTGSGAFQFTSAAYQTDENSVFALIDVRRTGGTSGTNADGSGNVSVIFSTSPGTAVDGVNYSNVVQQVVFPPGETFKTVQVPVIDDNTITEPLTVNLALSNPSPQTGIGDQTNAVLTIINNDSAVSFSSANYSVAKNTLSGIATINVVRLGTSFGTCAVDFITTTNGTAQPVTDFYPTNLTLTFNPGETNKAVNIRIVNNNLPEGNRTVIFALTNAVNTPIYDPSNATLTINDTFNAPGNLLFSTNSYFVGEGDGNAHLTVYRTNGNTGIVSVNYTTTPGTAVNGINYSTTSGTLSFGDGVTNLDIVVPLVDNGLVQGPVQFSVSLYAPAGGAVLASPTNATVTILDNDAGIRFVLATNLAPEDSGSANIAVQRLNNTSGVSSVNYATASGTAQAGVNYTTTSGTLTFTNGESLKVISVPLIDVTNVTGDLQFTISLSGPVGAQLTAPSNSVVIIQDADAGIHFTNSTLRVLKSAGVAVITVVNSNPRVEPVVLSTNDVPLSVQYFTRDGMAVAGVDYQSTSGTLFFTNGIATNTFTVQIFNNGTVTGDHAFTVVLTNVTAPGQLVPPSTQSVVIVESNAGLRFSQGAYTVFENGLSANINVFRTGYTDSIVSVDFRATNGTATSANFVQTNGTLVFTNGVTLRSFAVPIIANSAVQPNLTVLLQLSNPTNGFLVPPSAAVLTILENGGSYVIPAGSQMISETNAGTPNGLIDSNETVQILFAFRDAAGLNVTNLIAYLLATNGVFAPTPASQTYGPLTVYGHSVSRPFTFTAHGTNSFTIAPTFNLYDNAKFIGTAAFVYSIGAWTTSFTNTNSILIQDNTNALPYPSAINVGGLGGTLIKATVTLDKLSHKTPGDIDALVVSPSGSNTLIMAHAGGVFSVTNIVLTFDDAATNTLPQSNRMVSGTNKPTQFYPVRNFP